MKFEDELKNLGILQEECAEIIQAISKINRFGWKSFRDGSDNKEKLTQEIADFLVMIDILYANETINQHEVIKAKPNKINKLMKYYDVEPLND